MAYIISSGKSSDGIFLEYDSMTVLDGGIANSTVVNKSGRLSVSSGGVANSTTVNSGGSLTLRNGGTANNTTLNFGGSFSVLSMGTGNRITINSGGSLSVNSGGTGNNITINSGGSFSARNGGTANDITVSFGGRLLVSSGGEVNGATINSGGSLTVSRGGTATNIVWTPCVGHVFIHDGAVTTFASQYSGVYYGSNDRLLSHTAIMDSIFIDSSNEMFVMIDGIANCTTVGFGGNFSVFYGGTANDTIINSSGCLTVSSGGTANNTTINSGGSLAVSGGGTTNSTTLNSGGNLSVKTGVTANSTTVNSGGKLHVSSGGEANGTTINFGGGFLVSSGGTANSITVNSGGILSVSSGGTATDIVVSEGAHLGFTVASDTYIIGMSAGSAFEFKDGLVSNYTVESGGQLIIISGGFANSTTVNSGGNFNVRAGAFANSTTVNSGGDLYVSSGGTADCATISSGGKFHVTSGGTATEIVASEGARFDLTVASDTYIVGMSAGSAFEIKDGLVSNYTVESGGRLTTINGGFANSTTVNSSGRFYVRNGGTAISTTLSSGGELHVSNGGTADSTTVNSGGIFHVSSGGTAINILASEGARFDFTIASDTYIVGMSAGSAFEIKDGLVSNYIVKSGGRLNIISGGLANSTTVSAGGSLYVSSGGEANNAAVNCSGSLTVSSCGTANGTTVISGGSLTVSSGGTANSTTVNSGGRFHVSSGGTANSTIVYYYGSMHVSNGGMANSTTVSSGGNLCVSSGGITNNTEIIRDGKMTVSSGGTADNTEIYTDGRLILESGGTAIRTTVSAGGAMIIESGGKLDSVTIQSNGKLMGCFDCREVTFDSGASLCFDVSRISPENIGALVDITGLSGLDSIRFNLTISDSQEAGNYKLAEGAWGFDQTISVVNSVTQLGSLSIDQSVQINGREYTLSLNEGDLLLSVSAPPTAQYVYLDFDGEDLVRYNNSDLDISFDLSVTDPAFSEELRQTILSSLSEQYKKENIVFTLDRPEGVDYSTLYFGCSSEFKDYGDFFGVAETYDGNNQNKNDNAFILLDRTYSSGQIISVASHMLDHLMGFSYFVDGCENIGKYAENKILLSLSANWYQSNPYNKYCPIDSGGRCVTGCTNTAASQIIYYWLENGMLDFTLSLYDHDAYRSNKDITIDASDAPSSGHLSFAEINELLNDFKLEDEDCIAALCFAAGVIQKANYSSNATSTAWEEGLFIRAGFDEDTVNKKSMWNINWPQMSESYQDVNTRLSDDDFLVQELLQGRPVALTLGSIRHAIVLDGYDSSRNKFHLNFGWGGSSNQWYSLEQLISLRISAAVYGIMPVLYPLLTVEKLSVNDETVNLNEDVTLSFTISNEGKEASTETMVYIYRDDILLDAIGMTYVSPGFSREFSYTIDAASLPLGENILTVKVYSQKDEYSVSSASVTIDHIDNAAPRKPAPFADITTPTKADVFVSAEFSKLAVTKEYSLDSKTWFPYTNPVRVSENRSVFFRCANEAGDYSEVASYAVDNIDTAAPIVTGIMADITEPTIGTVTLTATFTDDIRLAQSFYRIGSTGEWNLYENGVTVLENVTVYFKAVDAVGRESEEASYTVTNIDTEKPTISGLVIVSGSRTVYSSQTYTDTTVNSDGGLLVSSGGTATDTTVNSEGNLFVLDGGTADRTTINASGFLYVSSGGTANDTTVNQSGRMYVSSCGTAECTTLSSGGRLYVSSGGTANSVRVNSGAFLYVSDGGKASIAFHPFGSGLIRVYGDAVVTDLEPEAKVYYGNRESGIISSADTMTDLAIAPGLSAIVCQEGRLDGALVGMGGNLIVSSGGTASGIIENGGFVDVKDGANITFLSNTFSCLTLTRDATVHSGTTAVDIPVNEGITLTVYRGGTAVGTTVNEDGELHVSSGGAADSTILNYYGSMCLYGGAANSTTIFSGGRLRVFDGGTANDTMVSSGGYLRVSSGGVANSATVESGGNLQLFGGGKLGGRTTIRDGAIVSAYAGAFIDFNVSEMIPEEDALLNDLSLVSDWANADFTLTVSALQLCGDYVLAGGVADFNKTISVVNLAGNKLGTLHVGETAMLNGAEYSLNLIDSVLSVTVLPDSIPPTISGVEADISSPTNGPVVVTATFTDNADVAQSLYRIGETGDWTAYVNGVAVTENTTVYFKAIDTAGNESEEVSFAVTNIDSVKPTVSNVMADITTPTNGNVIVTATFADDIELESMLYRLGNDDWTAYVNGVTVTENTTVCFKAIDTAGNESEEVSFTVANIDKTAPDKPVAVADVTTPTNGDVFVSVSFSEDSFLREYSFDGKEWHAYTEPVRFTENGVIRFRATNRVGNESEIETCEVRNIDKTPPEKPDVSADITTITNADVLVSAQFSEDSVVRKYSLNGKEWLEYEGPVRFTENGTVSFLGADAAGNESAVVSCTVSNIDKVAPGNPSDLLSVVSGQTVALLWNVSTDDFSGVKEYVVTYSLDGQAFTVMTKNSNYVLNNAEFGSYSWNVRAVDFAGNESAVIAGEAFTVSGFKPYTIEYSPDNFEHVIRFTVATPMLNSFRMPGGIYQLRIRQEGSDEWLTGDPIVATEPDKAPRLIKSDADGNADVFFANAVGIWESGYLAQHAGSKNDWNGTNEYAAIYGKNKLADIFEGSTDANILLLTDDPNGDGLFVDDIYSESPDELGRIQSRIAQIDEIRAGKGNDIVDMTSQQFEYIGDGLTIRGGEGNDIIWANRGNNWLFGDAGNDRIVGASGNDVIAGGSGNDRMHGGGGNDVFTFCENWGMDNVEQLAAGTVTLWFAESESQISASELDGSSVFTNAAGTGSVTVMGIALADIAVKYGDDGSDDYAALASAGAFFDATTERIFEESGKGMLASL